MVISQMQLLWWAGSLSLLLLVVSVVVVPLIVVRLPRDYLARPKRQKRASFLESSHRRRLYLVGKNLLGGLLLLAGVAMLVLPGQGILCMAVGLGIMDFPYKRRFVRRVAGRKRVLGAINRLRGKFDRAPLQAPE